MLPIASQWKWILVTEDLTSCPAETDISYRSGPVPEIMNMENFQDHFVHKGALQQCPDKTFYCPIPSFRTFLINRTKDPELREKAERLAIAERKTISEDSDWSPPEPNPYDDGSFGYS